MSRVTCHVSRVTCHLSHVTCQIIFFFLDKVVKLVREGLLSTGPTPSSFMSCTLVHLGWGNILQKKTNLKLLAFIVECPKNYEDGLDLCV